MSIRLLVTPGLKVEAIDAHVAKICQIHNALEQHVEVVVYDPSLDPGSYADANTRLYADADVALDLPSLRAVAGWGESWRLVVQSRNRRRPLYAYSGGLPGRKTLTQLVNEGLGRKS